MKETTTICYWEQIKLIRMFKGTLNTQRRNDFQLKELLRCKNNTRQIQRSKKQKHNNLFLNGKDYSHMETNHISS